MELVEIALFTHNVPQLADFYRRLLGTEPVHASGGTATFLVRGTKIFLHETYVPGDGELSPEDHIAFGVDDLNAVCEALQEQGITLEVEPRDFYWGRSAYLRAPNGGLIELTEKEQVDA